MSLIAELIQEQLLTENRWLRADEASHTQFLTFYSHAVPTECKSSSQSLDQVGVSIVIGPTQSLIQIIGIRPQVLAPQCTFAIFSRLQDDERRGLKLVASNLNRTEMGGQLYLELTSTGVDSKAYVDRLIGETGSGGGMLSPKSGKFGGHYGLESATLLLVCVIGLVIGRHLMESAFQGPNSIGE